MKRIQPPSDVPNRILRQESLAPCTRHALRLGLLGMTPQKATDMSRPAVVRPAPAPVALIHSQTREEPLDGWPRLVA